jgi:solute:Na+ symporter, SSS family
MVWTPFHFFLTAIYLAALLLIGILTGRKKRDSNQFLNATGALPLWVCMAACIAANCGSLDVIAMMALGAQYGMLACHFYWIGAIPALLVLVFWLMPVYARGRYPSILDFIGRFYGQKTRSAVALCMATMMLLLAGVCLCAVAEVLTIFLGLTFLQGILLTAPVVLFYTWNGGLRATIYSELLHFSVVLVAVAPLSFLVVHNFGGMHHLLAAIPASRAHAWQILPAFSPHSVMDRLGLIGGLGVVLSFGYWSTDFVLMQRALAVRRPQDMHYVPLALAVAKLLFAFLIVLPGVAAPLVLSFRGPASWNTTLPDMMLHYYNPAWKVIGIMGLAASIVATFADNISGFSSAWVQGIYRPWIRHQADEKHYLFMSRMTNVAAVLLAVGAAYLALEYQSLMDYMQMLFSTFNAPLFALVALAVLTPHRVARGGLASFLLGLASTVLNQTLARTGVLHFGSQMSANFYTAMLGFCVTAAAMLTFSCVRAETPLPPVSAAAPACQTARVSLPVVLIAVGIAGLCVLLNLLVW